MLLSTDLILLLSDVYFFILLLYYVSKIFFLSFYIFIIYFFFYYLLFDSFGKIITLFLLFVFNSLKIGVSIDFLRFPNFNSITGAL